MASEVLLRDKEQTLVVFYQGLCPESQPSNQHFFPFLNACLWMSERKGAERETSVVRENLGSAASSLGMELQPGPVS